MFGAIDLASLVLAEEMKLKTYTDEELIAKLDEYIDRSIALRLVLATIKQRPELYTRLLKEKPEIWI